MKEFINDRIFSGLTYGITTLGIWFNFENIKGGVLFLGAIILLYLQIRLHLIKIKKEKQKK